AKLGCPVIETTATSADGLKVLVEAAVGAVGKTQSAPYRPADVNPADKAAAEAEDRRRFAFVNGIVKEVEKRKTFTKSWGVGDKIDEVLTNKWLGIPIFAVVMFLVFQISQVWVGAPIADVLVGWLEMFQSWVGDLFTAADANPLLSAILVDGVIGGVAAVVGFLPLVMVMYFLIALLEDCGYMARVAVVLDPIFKKVGLSGKSVIPFVITVGCAVPGIMASRTIRNERERRATAMISPFMPCGAKIPIISLFAGMFFENAGWVSTMMYLAGIVLIFLCALLVNRIAGYRAKKSFFIIELPEYKIPSFWGAFKSMCRRGWDYIVKAATIILLCNMAVQIMQTFTWSFTVAESADVSILASIARPFAYLFIPIIGVLSWQMAAAAVTGFIAKENVVGTLAVCFVGLENLIDTEELALMEGAGAEAAGIMAITKVAALAYLMFNLYSPPCFAAIGAMNTEMKSAKWLWGGIGLQLAVGYTVAYLVYTIGTIVTGGALNVGAAVAGLIAVLAMAGVIIALIANTDKKLKAENAK
ncbi:MAG: ferrous iron transporter B, partial [Clostridia bacterium]|nr:ferrous iron transporter B [Clostridia bacterium]